VSEQEITEQRVRLLIDGARATGHRVLADAMRHLLKTRGAGGLPVGPQEALKLRNIGVKRLRQLEALGIVRIPEYWGCVGDRAERMLEEKQIGTREQAKIALDDETIPVLPHNAAPGEKRAIGEIILWAEGGQPKPIPERPLSFLDLWPGKPVKRVSLNSWKNAIAKGKTYLGYHDYVRDKLGIAGVEQVAVAVSDCFHSDRRYNAVYAKHGEHEGGLPGLWSYAADYAVCLFQDLAHAWKLEDRQFIDDVMESMDCLMGILADAETMPSAREAYGMWKNNEKPKEKE